MNWIVFRLTAPADAALVTDALRSLGIFPLRVLTLGGELYFILVAQEVPSGLALRLVLKGLALKRLSVYPSSVKVALAAVFLPLLPDLLRRGADILDRLGELLTQPVALPPASPWLPPIVVPPPPPSSNPSPGEPSDGDPAA